jgi:DNA-binding transcriptional LysR family regulator
VVASSDLLTVLPAHFVDTTGMGRALVVRELPLKVPEVHVDALWHRHHSQSPPHQWLLQTMARSALAAPAS